MSRVSTLLPCKVGTDVVKAVYALVVKYSKYKTWSFSKHT